MGGQYFLSNLDQVVKLTLSTEDAVNNPQCEFKSTYNTFRTVLETDGCKLPNLGGQDSNIIEISVRQAFNV